MADLIFSRRHDARPMHREEVARLAPAAFSDTQADHLSGRYGQVTTEGAMDVLADFGFHPVQAAQVQTRKTSRDHATHLIAFAQDNAERVGDSRPEIILYNSHDGTSSLKLFGGLFRFICSNGIVAGDGFEAKIRHTIGTVGGFEDMLRDVAGRLPDLMSRVDRMRGLQLDQGDMIDLAWDAAQLRWDMMPTREEMAAREEPLRGSFATDRTVERMLRAIRYDDRGADAWSVFNRLQESAIRGGVPVASFSPTAPNGKWKKARAVASVKSSVDVNRGLWDSMSKRLDLAPAAALEAA